MKSISRREGTDHGCYVAAFCTPVPFVSCVSFILFFARCCVWCIVDTRNFCSLCIRHELQIECVSHELKIAGIDHEGNT